MGSWSIRCLPRWAQCPESRWTRRHVRLIYKELVSSLEPYEVLGGN